MAVTSMLVAANPEEALALLNAASKGKRLPCVDVANGGLPTPGLTARDWQSDDGMTDIALTYCRTRCPVREECLLYALAVDERTGLWGGTTPAERRALARAARRAQKRGDGMIAVPDPLLSLTG